MWKNYKLLQERNSVVEEELQRASLTIEMHTSSIATQEYETNMANMQQTIQDSVSRESKLKEDIIQYKEQNKSLQDSLHEQYSLVSEVKYSCEEKIMALTQEHHRALKSSQSTTMELENKCSEYSSINAGRFGALYIMYHRALSDEIRSNG